MQNPREPNFLHRSWGPLEPFDDSMPELLERNGVYTHLVSDHYHYWEDGGCTYHTRYSSWEISRGQDGDPWKGEVADPEIPETVVEKESIPQIAAIPVLGKDASCRRDFQSREMFCAVQCARLGNRGYKMEIAAQIVKMKGRSRTS